MRRAVTMRTDHSMTTRWLPLLLLVALLGPAVPIHAQPSVTTIHVSLDGADVTGCGSSSTAGAACLSLRHALEQVPPEGATILIADGTYTGADNCNITLTASTPLRIAAANPGRVVLDAEAVAGRRHFTLTLGTGSPVSPPASDAVRIELHGLVLRGGRALIAGSLLVQGDGINAGALVSVSECVFEGNRLHYEPPLYFDPFAVTLPSAGAVFVSLAVLPGSLASAQATPAMVPPGPRVDPVTDILLNPASIGMPAWPGPPQSPYGSSAWTEAPPIPELEEEGGTFSPAVIFRSCVFADNTFNDPNPLTGASAAASLGMDGSSAALLNCTFRDHVAPATQVVILSGRGDTWMHGCLFERSNVGSLAVTLGDLFMPNPAMPHNLVVSSSRFSGLVAQRVPLPVIEDTLGKEVGSVLVFFGYGNVTFIDTHVSDNRGTAINTGAFGMFRWYGGSFTKSISVVDSLIGMPSAASLMFSGTAFTDNVGDNGGVVGTLAKDVLLHFHACTFSGNVAAGIGGVLDLSYATALTVAWFHQARFEQGKAVQGGVLAVGSTLARLVVSDSTFVRNDASRQGGAMLLGAGTNWFTNCEFANNSAPAGGAMALATGGVAHVQSSNLRFNRAYTGGAIWAQAGSHAELDNSVVEHNQALEAGGGAHDDAPLSYVNTRFEHNSAQMGGAIYFPAAAAPLVPAWTTGGVAVVASPLARTCTDIFAGSVHFEHNRASVFGGAIHFDGPTMPCADFCTSSPMGPAEARASVAAQWITDRCRFVDNKADGVYGAHFSSALHHAQLVPLGTRPGAMASAALAPSLTIAPGLPFGVAIELLDELNRTYAVTGGGATGATLQLSVFVDEGHGVERQIVDVLDPGADSTVEAGAAAPTSTPAGSADLASDDLLLGPALKPLTAHAGIVSFSDLQLFSAPIASGSSRRVIVRVHSDHVSMDGLALSVRVADCPPGLVLFNLGQDAGVPAGSLGLSCVVRPDFLPGDILKLRISAPLALLSCFVAVVGMWTSLILVEQIITARSRGRAYLHWVGLSTLAFGFSGAWCMAVIAVTGVEAYSTVTGATQSLGLRPEFVFGALAVLLAAPFLGLSLVFTDGDFAVQQRQYVKGLGKVNKYRQRDQAPAWQTRQAAKESNLFAEYEESTLYETSLNKNSLLVTQQMERENRRGGDLEDNFADVEAVDAADKAPKSDGAVMPLHTEESLDNSPTVPTSSPRNDSSDVEDAVQPQLLLPSADGDSDAAVVGGASAGGDVTCIEMTSPVSPPQPMTSRRLQVSSKPPARATMAQFESLPGATLPSDLPTSPSQADRANVNRGPMSQVTSVSGQAASLRPSASNKDGDHVISLQDSESRANAAGGGKLAAADSDKEAAPASGGMGLAFFVRKALSVRILLGLLIMFAGLASGLLLMLAALQLDVDDAQAEWSLGLVIGAVIIACAFFYPSLLAYLFLFTRLRTGAIFPLVGALLVCQYLSLSGLEWRRGPGASSTAATLDPSLMALIAFAISMVSCILLIGINVVSLRLSRHQLSQVLKGITVDLAKAQHQKQLLAAHIQELRTWLGLAVRGRLGTGPQQAAVIRPKGYAAGKIDKNDAAAAAALLDSGADVPSADRWLDLGVTVGLSTLSTEGAAASLRRDQEAAMLLAGADSAVFDSRPTAVRSALQRLQQLGLLTAHDVAGVGDLTSLPRITLEQVLGHPACSSFFLTHAARGHNEDSLLAFLSIAQFRHCSDEASRRSVASQIALDHLQSGAAYEVNVSAAMLDQVRSALHGDSTLSRSLFDGMAAELIVLMQTNSWASFVHTRAYWMCALILVATKHNQTKKKKMLQQHAQEIADMA